MKHMWKKNQIIITALAALVAVAGYLNYSGTKLGENALPASTTETEATLTDIDSLDQDITLTDSADGEVYLGEAAAGELTREQVRSKNKETLLEIINNENVTEEQKQNAVNDMTALTENAEKEAAAELLLESKGFTDAVVSITDGSVDVVIGQSEITDAQRAQIEDIVKRKTEISGENIVITTMQSE